MRPDDLRVLLEEMRSGSKSLEDALTALRHLPVEDLGFAQLDTHRELRQGLPEAIYGESKTPSQVVEITRALLETTDSPVIATRLGQDSVAALLDAFPQAEHHETARIVVARRSSASIVGQLTVACAGTSDLPVAEEAAVVAEALGIEVRRIVDVGVAGPHRLLRAQDRLHAADVVIVVAGMDGALPSLIGGLVAVPVIAVPTSVGYGASFEGLAPLLTMLNSCAAGVTVTNIDNGFGAACGAARILMGRSR